MTQLEGVAVVDRLMQRHIGQQVDAAFCRKHLSDLPNHTRKPHMGNSKHLAHRELLHRQHKIGEWWNIHRVAQQQNHRSALAGNVVQQFIEQRARVSIKPDIRIIHDENIGNFGEHIDNKELPQLSTREEIHTLVQNIGDREA